MEAGFVPCAAGLSQTTGAQPRNFEAIPQEFLFVASEGLRQRLLSCCNVCFR